MPVAKLEPVLVREEADPDWWLPSVPSSARLRK